MEVTAEFRFMICCGLTGTGEVFDTCGEKTQDPT